LDFSISYTTRAPRGSEEDGREYHFVTRKEFERMIAAGDFLEWAEVFGNYYGTAVSALQHAKDAGKDLLLDIDVQGAVQVMRKLPEAVSIFILPPSPQVLEMRLRTRSEAEHVTSEDVIQKRLAEARNELKLMRDYKYALVNDVLDQAVIELRAIVLCERGVRDGVQTIASSCRTDAASPKLRAALSTFQD
jgi:guanylate kinase